MIRWQAVVPLLMGLVLGTAVHAAVPTPLPSPTLAQVAACDNAALTLNLVNGKPMTLHEARRIRIGSVFSVPVSSTHVARVMRAGDNPWVLCREELAVQAQQAERPPAPLAVSEPTTPASAAKPIAHSETVRGNVPDATTASPLHFGTAPLTAVTQKDLSPVTPPLAANNASQTYLVSVDSPSGALWLYWLTPELTLILIRLVLLYLIAIVLIVLTIYCARTCRAFWKELHTREQSASPPQADDVPAQAALTERAPMPQGDVDIGFVLRVPGMDEVPFKASGAVSRNPRTIVVGGKQQQCFTIDGQGPWCAYLSSPKLAKTACLATYNNDSGKLTVECTELNQQVRVAIAPETTEPTDLDTAIRTWLASHGVDWRKVGLDAEDVRGPIVFAAKA